MTRQKYAYLQALDKQVDLIRWWNSPMGDRYAEAFLESQLDGPPLPETEYRRRPDHLAAPHEAHTYIAAMLDDATTYVVTRDMVELLEHATQTFPQDACTFTTGEALSQRGFVMLERGVLFPDIRGGTLSLDAFSWWYQRAAFQNLMGELDSMPVVTLCAYRRPGAQDTQEEVGDMPFDWHGSKVAKFNAPLEMWGYYPFGIDIPVSEQHHLLDRQDVKTTTHALNIEVEEVGSWRSGQHLWPSQLDAMRTLRVSVFLKVFFLLIQQKVPRVETQQADRHLRRRIERTAPKGPVPEVLVITLRRESEHGAIEPETDPVPGRWSHRWIVGGFWRNQYHPSKHCHIRRWINPYVKGPEDKPLIIKDKVYRWER